MLDWYRLQADIQRYVEQRKERDQWIENYRQQLLHFLREHSEKNWERWKEKAAASTEIVPDFDESPTQVYSVEKTPTPAVLLSSDGSQLYPSHHEIAHVALVNVSRVRIDYEQYQNPPLMESNVQLFVYEDLLQGFENCEETERPSFRDTVNDRRDVDEIEQLAKLADETEKRSGTPIAALSDGSFIQWHLQARKHEPYRLSILNGFLDAMRQFQKAGVLIAGYLSGSNSRDVVKLLSLVREDNFDTNAEQFTQSVMADTQLFWKILKPGQRSILFRSRSEILSDYPEDQRIAFFYLHVGSEIARVEIPQWIMQDDTLVNQVAEQCFRQAHLGKGYPVVLSEAHEQAVIRSAEREQIYAFLEQEMIRQGVSFGRSSKQTRKRMPVM